MPLVTQATFGLSALLTEATNPMGTGTAPMAASKLVNLATGTNAGQADKLYYAQRTLAASGTEDLDLAAVLTDKFGVVITMARVKGLYVSASASNVNNVVLGAGTNPWVTLLNTTGTVTLRPGSFLCVMAGTADATGYGVTAATGDVLKVLNSGAGTSVTYDVAIIGCSV